MSYLSDGLTWLSDQLRDAAGQTVSIRRGASTTASVIAVVIDHGEIVENKPQATTAIIDRRWRIAVTAYMVASVAVDPRVGDRIVDADSVEWEVLPASIPAAVARVGGDWEIATKRVKA